MASLKELKGRINSVKSTQKITKAKQMVAAAKLRKAQAAAEAARPYAQRLAAVMASLAGKVAGQEGAPKLLAGTGRDSKHLLVVANSDKGLAGAFNSNIVRAALTKARELQAEGNSVAEGIGQGGCRNGQGQRVRAAGDPDQGESRAGGPGNGGAGREQSLVHRVRASQRSGWSSSSALGNSSRELKTWLKRYWLPAV